MIQPTVTSTKVSASKAKEQEAYDMAIEALSADRPTKHTLPDGTEVPIDEESYEIGYTEGQMADRPTGECRTCGRNADNGGVHEDGRTKCPIQEHYALLLDGYCHLYEPYKGGDSE